MSLGKCKSLIFSLTIGGLLLGGLFLLLDGASQVIRADPGVLFARTNGAGAACTQANPCDLQTAIAQATASTFTCRWRCGTCE